jgi:peptidoglycan hydrolase-like protein with peptidoglycan-binding domain
MKTLFVASIAALSLSGAALAAGPSGTAGSQNNDVTQVQQKLKSEGLYNGPVDGIDGPKTQQALKQFQQKNGLSQTGKLDQKTESKLGIGESSGSSMPPAGSSSRGGTSGMSGMSNSGTQK